MEKSQLEQLEQHYLDTAYLVFIDGEQYDINIGKPLPPDIEKLVNKEKSAVILTAWNPRSEPLSLQENRARNIELKSKLKMHTVFEVLGQGDDLLWNAEESFFVIGLNKADAERIAVEYGQYAYVSLENIKPASLIFTSIWK